MFRDRLGNEVTVTYTDDFGVTHKVVWANKRGHITNVQYLCDDYHAALYRQFKYFVDDKLRHDDPISCMACLAAGVSHEVY